MKTVAILGYPGAGKTTAVYNAVRMFLSNIEPGREILPSMVSPSKIGLVEYQDLGHWVVIGKYDGSTFQGTDRLSMAVAPDFPKFFEEMLKQEKKLIVAEGDRINNSTFMRSALAVGTLERIKCDPGDYKKLLQQRKQRGHEFSPKFLKTVASKVDKHNFDQTMDSDSLFKYLNNQTKNL